MMTYIQPSAMTTQKGRRVALATTICTVLGPLFQPTRYPRNSIREHWESIKIRWGAASGLPAARLWASIAYGDPVSELLFQATLPFVTLAHKHIQTSRAERGLLDEPLPAIAHDPVLSRALAFYASNVGELSPDTLWHAYAIKMFMVAAQYLDLVDGSLLDDGDFDENYTAEWLRDDLHETMMELVNVGRLPVEQVEHVPGHDAPYPARPIVYGMEMISL